MTRIYYIKADGLVASRLFPQDEQDMVLSTYWFDRRAAYEAALAQAEQKLKDNIEEGIILQGVIYHLGCYLEFSDSDQTEEELPELPDDHNSKHQRMVIADIEAELRSSQ